MNFENDMPALFLMEKLEILFLNSYRLEYHPPVIHQRAERNN